MGRRSELLEEVAATVRERGGQSHAVAVDLTSPGAPALGAVAQDHFGVVNVLISNAGNVRAERLETSDEPEVLAQIALNLTAPILLTRAVIPAPKARGDGLVLNVSPGLELTDMPLHATYAATKAGIAHFGDALRREFCGDGVHVLNVYPGAAGTTMMDSSQARAEHGFEYESPQAVAAAAVAAMERGVLTEVRGGAARTALITLSREDPAVVERLLFARKAVQEEAVDGHSSI